MMSSYQILVIDHKESFVELCRGWLQPEGFTVQVALNGDEALEIIQSEPLDLVLLELALPDSLQLLARLKENGLDVPVILSVEDRLIPVQQVAQAIRLGTVSFMQQPARPEPLLENIWALLDHYAPGVVRGNMRDLGLTSLITILCNEGRQAGLDIRYQAQQATLFFEKGEIIHAELNGFQGEEAIYEVLTWEEGDFALTMGRISPEQTINTSWTKLLLEGLQRIDETAFSQEQLEPEELPPPTDWPDDMDMMGDFLPPPREQTFVSELDSHTQSQIDERLDRLYQEIKLRCILFAGHSGRLLAMQGQLERSRALSLAALVAGSFSAVDEMAEILAEEDDENWPFQQSLQEGQDFSLYSAQINQNWILAVVFEPGVTNLGLARQMTLQAAADLQPLLEQAQETTTERHEVADTMNEEFRQEVSNALGDLFG